MEGNYVTVTLLCDVAVVYVSFAVGGAILLIALAIIIVLVVRHRSDPALYMHVLFRFTKHLTSFHKFMLRLS